MKPLMILLAGAASQTVPSAPMTPAPATAAEAPVPPVDWTGLPELRFRRPASLAPALSGFVRSEVAAGRCDAATRRAHGQGVRVELAVLITGQGAVGRVVPRAISCPTVEQYASGLLLGMARDNVEPLAHAGDSWYRTNFDFEWAG